MAPRLSYSGWKYLATLLAAETPKTKAEGTTHLRRLGKCQAKREAEHNAKLEKLPCRSVSAWVCLLAAAQQCHSDGAKVVENLLQQINIRHAAQRRAVGQGLPRTAPPVSKFSPAVVRGQQCFRTEKDVGRAPAELESEAQVLL